MTAGWLRHAGFAAAAALLASVLCVAALLAADVYAHARVQNVAGVNVWGYRGPAIPAKRAGERRIVVLGGSTAFGFGVPWDQAWPFYLEQELNARRTARVYSVVNLGAPGQGAYGFRFDLADYAYLRYDTVVFYEGYNDLGEGMTFDPTPRVVNHYLWRQQSPVFRMTGYFPVLPLVFREKAMQLRAGGDIDAAYRRQVSFKPGLATRATASAFASAAAISASLGERLGRLTAAPALSHEPLDMESWTSYTTSVLEAVADARARGAAVLVVTQPYISDRHVRQQRALASTLADRFGADLRVRYVNLGTAVDMRDRSLAYDGMHLVGRANRVIAEHLVEPVTSITR